MAQQATTPFWPIFTRKSDGQEIVPQRGAVLKNGPTAQQLDRTPNAQGQCDYYRLIDRDEPKHVDWRKKLGGMLLREIGGKQYEDKWAQCILWDFPDGYRLYEHIKSKADGQTKPVKNHSGGGHDRQDAYLYGYPKGPKKRFRSPVEFFPHLLWLASDDATDNDNCSCKMCSPFQLEPEKPPVKAEPAVVIKKENSPAGTPPVSATGGRNPAAQIPLRRPSSGPMPTQSPMPTAAAPHQPRPVSNPAPVPTPLPQPRSIDQQVDAQYGKLLARTGEITWFHRAQGAWGLGVVTRRWIPKDGSSTRAYLVQPLSHPFDAPPTQLVLDDTKIKPWLAWSAPGCTFPFLNQNEHLTYEQVPWNSLLSGQYGDGNCEVDASILAAKAIDTSYTPFERLKQKFNAGWEERHWNGIFLGAEKVWNGEPVRLRMGSGTDIMVVTDIIERVPPPTQTAQNAPSSSVQFVGDVYTYATMAVSDPASPPEPPQHASIPLRMREDMAWRNRSLVPATRSIAYWRLISTQRRLDISEIKGRWYETSLVFANFFNDAIKNKGSPNGTWMNSRGDATKSAPISGQRLETRIIALGAAVPKDTVTTGGGADPSFALDEFMNLDNIDTEPLPFDDQFNFGLQ
ncbi:hypothetical protein K491DRAFT_766249 [Lophiostoma macrostomum CBS 122681]|uniref:Cryptic loci regulator 2 N-terminal domain-containing protein n=1 Tax=Lophiostoma macrostomum CBS 122681 TaxID=1314788 RepID=A0A6A6TGN1_9PLEO|nr:hypothetical protein K491DRAFT_766249 [Lophiostoma macrostomum CBS 122681]